MDRDLVELAFVTPPDNEKPRDRRLLSSRGDGVGVVPDAVRERRQRTVFDEAVAREVPAFSQRLGGGPGWSLAKSGVLSGPCVDVLVRAAEFGSDQAIAETCVAMLCGCSFR